ncbi:MAG: thioesterase family protein [bacterium]
MTHSNIVKIYHKETDCYGVVWHGEYIKWFEIGRIEFSELIGISFNILNKMGILLPVVEINCRYKSPARLMDKLSILTELKELKNTSITFFHAIKNIDTDNLILNATSTVVTTNKEGKLFKKIPDYLYEKYVEYLNNKLK